VGACDTNRVVEQGAFAQATDERSGLVLNQVFLCQVARMFKWEGEAGSRLRRFWFSLLVLFPLADCFARFSLRGGYSADD
jgi:hypothetical protein